MFDSIDALRYATAVFDISRSFPAQSGVTHEIFAGDGQKSLKGSSPCHSSAMIVTMREVAKENGEACIKRRSGREGGPKEIPVWRVVIVRR